MEEELNYANVTFKTNSVSTYVVSGKAILTEIIYDEVKTPEKTLDTHPIIKENKKRAQLHPLPFLGVACFILMLSIIILSVFFAYEQRRQADVLTRQNRRLEAALEKRTAELYRETNRLNWTLGVILEYDNFPVTKHCPHKVCKPCLDDWELFQSNCYLFTKHKWVNEWKNWEKSREFCTEAKAELVVINSQEEQEFIHNKTEQYNDQKHGYWVGLKKDTKETWMWADGRNVTLTLQCWSPEFLLMRTFLSFSSNSGENTGRSAAWCNCLTILCYWSTEKPGYQQACGLVNPHLNQLSSWDKVSCSMKNRWICETRALMGPD